MARDENSYGNILRRIGAFGGVQVFNIFVSLLRGKFVALFLGPDGMGVSALYNSSAATIQQLCGLGLNLAMVKEVAAAKDSPARLRRVLSVTVRMLLATVLLGAVACAALAPLWSRLTFGDGSQTWSYVWLSLFVALSIAGAGYLALLQGLGEVKRLSKASLVGGLTGLFVGVPLYRWFGVAGIVPAMILLALSTFVFYYVGFRRVRYSACRGVEAGAVSGRDDSAAGEAARLIVRRLVSLGFILLVGSLAGTLVGYLINLYIRSEGSVEDVGLFQAANSITNQYVGLIFSALALDYFPRLSAICHDGVRLRDVVNRQTEIVMLVATPLIILLIVSAPLIIRVLFTTEFLCVIPLMRWMGFGMLVQALAFPLGYIYVAREDRRVYVWMECVWANVCWLGCTVLFYSLFGLTGLGMSLVARGVVDLGINYLICVRRYGFGYTGGAWLHVAAAMLLGGGAFLLSLFVGGWPGYAGMCILLLLSLLWTWRGLRRGLRGEA